MNSTNQFSIANTTEAYKIAKSLRGLYFTRVAFSVLWIILVITLAKTSEVAAAILFIMYPAWDVVATFLDIRSNTAAVDKAPQYINAGISTLTTIAVFIALKSGIPATLMVFGVWASLTGLIQLVLGIRRRKLLEGQWPMIISGAQSILAGIFIIATAHTAKEGIVSLIGYSAFGAFYFILAAFRLGRSINKETFTTL